MASSSSKLKPNGRPPKSKKPATSKATMKKSHLSEEMVVDSDDEDALPREQSPKPATASAVMKPSQKLPSVISKMTNGTKRKSEHMSSSSGSDDESETSASEDEEDTAGKQAKKAKVEQDKVSSSQETESSEEESGSEDEDDIDEHMPDVDVRLQTSTATPHKASGVVPSQRFGPPTGFTALHPQAMSSSLLASADLTGKQIWHICAPSNVPLESITEIASNAIKSNTTVLTYQGVHYTWSESPDSEMCTLLLSSKDGYMPMQHKIAKKLDLRQKIDLPHLTSKQASQVTGSSAAADISKASVTTIRPQPKGLRMRYKPPGFGKGDPEFIGLDSDDESQDGDKSALQFPATLGGASEKQTATGSEKARKKSKKNKESAAKPNGVLANGKAGTRHVDDSSATAANMANGTGAAEHIDLERQRKEAKRLKKEAKKAKLAASKDA